MEGGLGAAVQDAFAGVDTAPTYQGPQLQLIKLAVQNMPGSGKPQELMHEAKIDAEINWLFRTYYAKLLVKTAPNLVIP
ncbi:MAG: hypothetical protein RIG63_06190 [Coleofasciculus chthonoplastes F3-SA18-01]|jgi:transketolase